MKAAELLDLLQRKKRGRGIFAAPSENLNKSCPAPI